MKRHQMWTPLFVLAVAALLGSAAASTSPADLESALGAALDDERHAQATYRAVLDRFGDVRPFSRIVEAEGHHEAHLLSLYRQLAMAVPADPWPEREIELPATLAEACAMAAQAEKDNIALYDELLVDLDSDLTRPVFERLRAASADHHLPAFERCASGKGGAGGPGHGQGKGMGKGGGKGTGGCGGCGGC